MGVLAHFRKPMDWTPVLVAALPSLITYLVVQSQIKATRQDTQPDQIAKWIDIANRHRDGEQEQEKRADLAELECARLAKLLAEEQYYTEKLKAALMMHDMDIPERKKDVSNPLRKV